MHNKNRTSQTAPRIFWYGVYKGWDQPRPEIDISPYGLTNSTTPTTPSEVCSFLGMANFSALLIPYFATITEPLRLLTQKNILFEWGDEQEKAYQQLKTVLVSKPVMSYFDPSKETVILVDASRGTLCNFSTAYQGVDKHTNFIW